MFPQIFTEDLPEVESLPRDRVLGFLVENFKGLAIPYLVRSFFWSELKTFECGIQDHVGKLGSSVLGNSDWGLCHLGTGRNLRKIISASSEERSW